MRAYAQVSCLAMLGVVLLLPASVARDILSGPIPARVIAVFDGDTLKVRAHIWLGQEVEIYVRLDGVDAPEMNGKCSEERALAKRARAFVESRIGDNAVVLHHIRHGKYAGRVLARVETKSGEDLGDLLLAAGLARPYDGGRRPSWCPP